MIVVAVALTFWNLGILFPWLYLILACSGGLNRLVDGNGGDDACGLLGVVDDNAGDRYWNIAGTGGGPMSWTVEGMITVEDKAVGLG